jgi:hypothetical protein
MISLGVLVLFILFFNDNRKSATHTGDAPAVA